MNILSFLDYVINSYNLLKEIKKNLKIDKKKKILAAKQLNIRLHVEITATITKFMDHLARPFLRIYVRCNFYLQNLIFIPYAQINRYITKCE